jgi:hypothetical protein
MFIQRRHFLIGGAAAGMIPGLAGAQEPPPVPRVPFDFTDGKIRLPVRIKDIEVSAVLDSGGQYHVMDAGLARTFGIALFDKVNLGTLSGNVSGRLSDPVDIVVAGQALPQSQFVVVDLSHMSQSVGRAVDLIIGQPLFRRFDVDFDFAQLTLAVMPPKDYVLPESGAMAPLATAARGMTVEAILPVGSVQATVDTGSEACLTFSPSAAKRLGVLKDGPVSTALIGGLGAARVGRVTSIKNVLISGQEFEDVPVVVSPREFGGDAVLGCGLLSHCHVAFDFPGDWLIFSDKQERPFRRDLTGLQASAEESALRVTHVAKGGPAEKAGFRIGEKIVALNGEPAAIANARMTDAAVGTKVAFGLQGGKTRTLTLARYY